MSPRLEVVKPGDEKIVHTCSCKRTFTMREWDDLVLVGFIDEGHEMSPPFLEQRNCSCGSTRAVSIGLDRLIVLVNNQCKSVRRATSELVDAMRVRGEAPDREERTGPVELVRIEREACAQAADKVAADLRLVAAAKPGVAMKRELWSRAELADEIAASIRRRS